MSESKERNINNIPGCTVAARKFAESVSALFDPSWMAWASKYVAKESFKEVGGNNRWK